MSGKTIGYIKESAHWNIERRFGGMQFDRTCIDKTSGKDVNRPQLRELLEYTRDGDIIKVHSMASTS